MKRSKRSEWLKSYRDAKAAGMTAEDVFAMVLESAREHAGKWRVSEIVMMKCDSLERIEAVFGKRARARCEALEKAPVTSTPAPAE